MSKKLAFLWDFLDEKNKSLEPSARNAEWNSLKLSGCFVIW